MNAATHPATRLADGVRTAFADATIRSPMLAPILALILRHLEDLLRGLEGLFAGLPAAAPAPSSTVPQAAPALLPPAILPAAPTARAPLRARRRLARGHAASGILAAPLRLRPAHWLAHRGFIAAGRDSHSPIQRSAAAPLRNFPIFGLLPIGPKHA